MTEKAPGALYRLYALVAKGLPGQTMNGGVIGDQRHGSGYHRSRNALRAAGKYSDYSIQASRDKKGNGDYASALDVTFHRVADLIAACKRMERACLAKDKRLNALREWIGTLDGKHVIGYSPYRGHYITSSDTSHLWHMHLSIFRDSNENDGLLAQIAAVLVGTPVKPYVWDGKSFPGSSRFYVGVRADWVTYLGRMLVKAGFTGYQDGPGPEFSTVDKAGVRWFQLRQGWTGSDADGIPGAETWSRLQAIYLKPTPTPVPPKPKPKPTPVPVPPKPKPVPVPVTPGCRKIIELDAPGGGNWQAAVQSTGTKDWFIAHSRGRADGGEDVLLYRFNAAGKYRDHMTLPNCAHVYGFGVSDTNIVWLTWNGHGTGNDVVTFQYRPGTISKADTQQMHVFTDRPAGISFSPTRSWAVVRQAGFPAGHETYRLYTKQDILDGNNDPWGRDVVIAESSSRVVQGFSVADRNLYVLIGLAPGSAFRVEKWSFATGRKLGELKLDRRLGLPAGVDAKVEPEGMDGDTFGMKVNIGAQRRMVVYKLTDF